MSNFLNLVKNEANKMKKKKSNPFLPITNQNIFTYEVEVPTSTNISNLLPF